MEYNEDSDGLVSLNLAKLYAMKGRREKMISNLARATLLRDCSPQSLEEYALYLNACSSSQDIFELRTWLKWEAPISRERFEEWISQQQTDIHRSYLELLAWRRETSFILNSPRKIYPLRVFKIEKEGSVLYQIQWEREKSDDKGPFIRIPKTEDSPGFSFYELWDTIDQMCILVSALE